MTEDRDKVLCRGEPVKDDIAEGAEIKIRIWTVHVTDEVHAYVTLCSPPPLGARRRRAAVPGARPNPEEFSIFLIFLSRNSFGTVASRT